MLTYEEFRDRIKDALKKTGPLTWTEIRTIAKLPEKFPNNKWVRKLEQDISLKRGKDSHGIIKWQLGRNVDRLVACHKQTGSRSPARQ